MNELTPSNGALMSFIERAAKDDTFDVSKFETLLRVRRDEAHDHARRVFNAAMAACQSEMEPVLRGSTNPGVRSKYAKLEAIDQQMRPIYTRHGFSVRFGSAPPPQPGWMRITCTVAHESGYFEENYLDSPVTTQGSQGGRIAMTPVQAVGSVVTYLRRYLLGMVFNIVQADVVGEDNDGEGQRPFDDSIPLKAAAAATPRAPRVVDPTPYEARAPTPKAERKSWSQWAESLELADRDTKNTAEIGRIIARAEVAEIVRLAQEGEASPAKTRIVAAFRSLEERYLADPPQPPKDDDLDEVVIAGQEKMEAG